MNYYSDELKKINVESQFAPNVKIISGEGNGSTKWMNINKESAEALVKWLTENFINK